MKLKQTARFWMVIAGPPLLPICAAVVIFLLSCAGAHVAGHPPGNVIGKALSTSASALEHFAGETAAVLNTPRRSSGAKREDRR